MRSLERHQEADHHLDIASDHDHVEAEHDPAASRRASMADLRRQDPVQRKANGADASNEAVHAAAAQGVTGSGAQLPHLAAIQRSFGRHDVSGIQAHVGGDAARASDAMGAEAYATGNHVAFAEQPDLHTAAHEAAHVVQQSQGVNLYGGVGMAGDQHEKQADAVADRVVAGQSAEDLLGPVGKSPAAAAGGAVQHKKKAEHFEDANKDQQDEQHENAGRNAFWAIQQQILLAASRLHDMTGTIKSIVQQKEFDEAGGDREAQILINTYDDAFKMVASLSAHAHASAGDIKGFNFLGQDLAKLEGAFFQFSLWYQKSTSFVQRHGYPVSMGTKTVEIQHKLHSLYSAFGKEPQEVARDTRAPEGGTAKVEEEAINATLKSLFQHLRSARMDSQTDLESGHKQMIAASHRATEAHELLGQSSEKHKQKKYGALLKDIEKEANWIADNSVNLYMDGKVTGLFEKIAEMRKMK